MNTFVIDGVKFQRTGVSVKQKLAKFISRMIPSETSCRQLVGGGRMCKRYRLLGSYFCKKHSKVHEADPKVLRTMKQVTDSLLEVGFTDQVRKKNGTYWFVFRKKFWRPSYIRSLPTTAGEWIKSVMTASEFFDKPVFCVGCCKTINTQNGRVGKFGRKCRCHGQPLYLCDRCVKKHEEKGR